MKRLAAAAVIGAMLAGTAACEQTQPVPDYEKMLVLQEGGGLRGQEEPGPGSEFRRTLSFREKSGLVNRSG
jgi:hypothetical protein